tara:strand:+ start:87 stop:296 length:210 start_codon:yes stop_codon:yes gene_type:complete
MLQNARLNDTICKQSQLPYPNSYKGGSIMNRKAKRNQTADILLGLWVGVVLSGIAYLLVTVAALSLGSL